MVNTVLSTVYNKFILKAIHAGTWNAQKKPIKTLKLFSSWARDRGLHVLGLQEIRHWNRASNQHRDWPSFTEFRIPQAEPDLGIPMENEEAY